MLYNTISNDITPHSNTVFYYILKCNIRDGKAMEAWSHHGVKKNLTIQICFFFQFWVYISQFRLFSLQICKV